MSFGLPEKLGEGGSKYESAETVWKKGAYTDRSHSLIHRAVPQDAGISRCRFIACKNMITGRYILERIQEAFNNAKAAEGVKHIMFCE